MEPQKAEEFLTGVMNKTREGRVPWEPTAAEDLVALIGGEFTLRVFPRRRLTSVDEYALVLLDAEDREVARVDTLSYNTLSDKLQWLYNTARDQALRVDETVDKLMGVLERL